MTAARKFVFDPCANPTKPQISKIIKQAKDAVMGQSDYSPYPGIIRLLNEKPPLAVVSSNQLLAMYASGSIRVRKDRSRIDEGIRRICCAYDLAMYEFERLDITNPKKKFRKDGQTPLVAHPSRVALIGAYLGAGSHQISSLLLHDCPEDCNTRLGQIRSLFGNRVATFVALLTKPKLFVQEGKKGNEIREWVFLINDERRWGSIKAVERPEYYEESIKVHFAEILNTRIAKSEIKLKAHFYKLAADSLDNLVSDIYLNPTKARIRCAVLIPEIRHLEITGPTVRTFFIDLLRERGFDINDKKSPRMIPDQKVIECTPLDRHLTSYVLDSLPSPNGYVIVYVDEQMKSSIQNRNFKGKIRVELSHTAPDNSPALLQSFMHNLGIEIRCETGESLLTWANEAAGRHVMVRGINGAEKYKRFLNALAQFHDLLLTLEFSI